MKDVARAVPGNHDDDGDDSDGDAVDRHLDDVNSDSDDDGFKGGKVCVAKRTKP